MSTGAVNGDSLRVHLLTPWIVFRTLVGQEETAQQSLEREQQEAYFPLYSETIEVRIPARKISSKTRYRRRSEIKLITKITPIFPGYVFSRPLVRQIDLYRAHELPGVLGVCWVGDRFAQLQDWDIEEMRWRVAAGVYSRWRQSKDPTDIRKAERMKPTKLVERFEPYEVARLDFGIEHPIVFIRELDRITGVVAAPGGFPDGVSP